MSENKECRWEQYNYDSETYETACRKMFSIEAGSPLENGFKYCPFCGGALRCFAIKPEGDGGGYIYVEEKA